MRDSLHPAATHHVPGFIPGPGESDVLLIAVGVFLVIAVLALGILFLRLHTMPERLAHKGQKLQFEVVAVLGLLALFTHMHIFWVAGLLLALIDLPDFGTPLRRMAGALEKIARIRPFAADEASFSQPEETTPAAEEPRTAERARHVLTPVDTKGLTRA